jgi:hypothetical protein
MIEQEEEESGSDGYYESLESSDSDPESPKYSPEVSNRQRIEQPNKTKLAHGESIPLQNKVCAPC